MQNGLMMTEKWCGQAQHDKICHGCRYNEKRDKSNFQQERDQEDGR